MRGVSSRYAATLKAVAAARTRKERDGALPPGTRIGGRYVLARILGSGAMGTVYEARDAAGGAFALKTLFAAEEEERRARFLREAAVCATIHHPHVVPVLDHGIDTSTEVPFFVMPLLEGEDLAAVLDRVGALEPHVAVALFVQACEGLAAVHARGIVHRDVKPSNLFLEAQASAAGPGRENIVVKVTDFGLAKAFGDLGEPGKDGTTSSAYGAAKRIALTATGRFMGTPQYVSPEQAISAKHVDVRSDVFSLAMSLYHALSGAPAFAYVRSFMGLVLEITSREAPHLQDAAPWISPALARIVHSALLREPEARCPNVRELALALDMAVGIDASRSPVTRDSLRPVSTLVRRFAPPRAELATSWEGLLRS
jgi:serine/threonine-protein kinase